ncbi:hypothetical protein [Cytophaga aurantiaca]|uniref:hypothetical protein n=1 Tax=Cytophaga aurantiaca TaxID=29530 RepID=UPI00039F1D01|nr:hypothetical protein [Cytophaga aurantiaca]
MKSILPKFKFKGEPTVINAPADLSKEFIAMGFPSAFDKKAKSKDTLIFVNNKKEYITFMNKNLDKIESDSVLWFAYPKGTSGIKTDVNRDSLWAMGEEYGITSVSAISINDVWSALRFRPIDRVGKK